MQSMKFMQRLLRLYPRLWRERYETEMLILLEQHHITFATVIDLLLGALDARLDPHYRSPGPLFALNSRRTLATLFVSALAVSIYGVYLLRIIEFSLRPQGQTTFTLPLTLGILIAQIDLVSAAGIFVVFVTALISNFLLSINMLKKDLAAHRKIRPLITLSRFLTPFLLFFPCINAYRVNLFPPHIPVSMNTLVGTLLILLILELWVGSLFTTFIKIGELISERVYELLPLAFCVSLLMPMSLILPGLLVPPWTRTPDFFFNALNVLIPLMAFIPVSSLLLFVARSEMNKRTFLVALFAAVVLALLMIANLACYGALAIMDCLQGPMLGSRWDSWLLSQGRWFYVLIADVAVMALALAIALIALLRGFATLVPHRSTHSDASETHLIQSQQRR